jgi:hypothetical protein
MSGWFQRPTDHSHRGRGSGVGRSSECADNDEGSILTTIVSRFEYIIFP